MEKKLIQQEVSQQEPLLDSDWTALSDSELAAVGGGCGEFTPY